MSYAEELRKAIEAVRQASRLCQEVQKRLVEGIELTKGDKSPVTVADFGAQAIVSYLLEQSFPEIPLVGEEDASELRQPTHSELKDKVVAAAQSVLAGLDEQTILAAIDRGTYEGGAQGKHWCLDPIDGTKGFLRGEQYAVALALIEDGEVVLGVLGCPNLPHDLDSPHGSKGSLFVGEKGNGAYQLDLNSSAQAAISVVLSSDPSSLKLCESVEKAHTSQSDSAKVAERLGIVSPPVRIDSQCKYATVARGDAAIYLRLPTKPGYQEKIWDHAAGWRVIVEAGGCVSDVYGKPLDFSLGRTLAQNKGVIVTNGPLHEQVLESVQEVLGL